MKPQDHSNIKTIRINPQTIKKIKALAEDEGRTFSNMANRLLTQAVKQLKEEAA